MSERPFMQLYVSDFVGDTLHLSTEQIGAYMLLLMAMWNAGGQLPADDAKLSRIVRMSVKKWRAINADLMPFFEGDAGHIWHNRLTKELQKSEGKSQSRAAAGAKGGVAKALKTQDAPLANATDLPQQNPSILHIDDTSLRSVSSPETRAAAQPSANTYEHLLERLTEAAGLSGFREEKHTGLATVAPILGLLEAGYDLDADILPAIRAKCATGFKPRTWAYFIEPIREAALTRTHASSKPKPAAPEIDWLEWCRAFFEDNVWKDMLGPRPGEPGCRAPPDIIQKAQQERAA